MGDFFHWNADPELVQLGPFAIRWYGACFAAGFYLGLRWFRSIGRIEKIDLSEADRILLYGILGTVIGARLGHALIYEPALFLSDPLRILRIWEGGLASHGGTLGFILGVYLWKRRFFKGSLLYLLDLLSIPGALCAGMIRIGNLFNSEILGTPSTVPWAVVFSRIDSTPRHPAMIYEALVYFGLSVFLFGLLKKKIHSRFGDGFLLGIFLVVVYGSRFCIEFVKEVQVGEESGLLLNFGQMLSIPFVLAGVILIVRAIRVKKSR